MLADSLEKIREHLLWTHDVDLPQSTDLEPDVAEEEPPPPYEDWLNAEFPFVASAPLAEHHHRLWSWLASLERGVLTDPLVEIWARGGAKSSTVELGCAYVCRKRTRRFVLYVSATQDLADKHVSEIAGHLEKLGIQRALNVYGNSKGWKRNQLSTATGFHVVALGLDSAGRGIKLEGFRPDLIVLDDVDERDDTAKTTEKKISSITNTILPAGSTDAAVLFVQNLIHEDSIASRLVDGRAEFLATRRVPGVVPAVYDLETQLRYDEDRQKNLWVIVKGRPSWEGQNLQICENQIQLWGLTSFLREAQHKVEGADGVFFDVTRFRVVEKREDLPPFKELCRAWDFAATQGGGDATASSLGGRTANQNVCVIDGTCDQLSSDNVRKLLIRKVIEDRLAFPGVKLTVRLPQDPGGAGKDQALQLSRILMGLDLPPSLVEYLKSLELSILPAHCDQPVTDSMIIAAYKGLVQTVNVVCKPVTGSKAVRARGWQDHVNSGNALLLKGNWNEAYKREHRKFKEDETHDADDQVDAASDMYNYLTANLSLPQPGGAKRQTQTSKGFFL